MYNKKRRNVKVLITIFDHKNKISNLYIGKAVTKFVITVNAQ